MPLKSEILYKFLDSKNNAEEAKMISESEEDKEENKQGKKPKKIKNHKPEIKH